MKQIVLLLSLLAAFNANADLCPDQMVQPGGESYELWGVSKEKRANAISQQLRDGCAESTDLVGQRTYSAKWIGDQQNEFETRCQSITGGGLIVITVTFDSYPYSHARFKRDGGCERVIQNATEVELLRQQGKL